MIRRIIQSLERIIEDHRCARLLQKLEGQISSEHAAAPVSRGNDRIFRFDEARPGLAQISIDVRALELSGVDGIDDQNVLNLLASLIRIVTFVSERVPVAGVVDESFAAAENDDFIVA